MTKGNNGNHPVKGSTLKVEPIKSLNDIKAVKTLFAKKPRDLALFIVGVNTNLRAVDILKIKVAQARNLKPLESIEVKEQKTGKLKRIKLNKACVDAIRNLIASRGYQDDDYLFLGQIGRLTVPSVNRLVKGWCAAINLKGNFGAHTLRKTFGYIQRVVFGTGLPELMVCFNHSTQRQTLEYLCASSPKRSRTFRQMSCRAGGGIRADGDPQLSTDSCRISPDIKGYRPETTYILNNWILLRINTFQANGKARIALVKSALKQLSFTH